MLKLPFGSGGVVFFVRGPERRGTRGNEVTQRQPTGRRERVPASSRAYGQTLGGTSRTNTRTTPWLHGAWPEGVIDRTVGMLRLSNADPQLYGPLL